MDFIEAIINLLDLAAISESIKKSFGFLLSVFAFSFALVQTLIVLAAI